MGPRSWFRYIPRKVNAKVQAWFALVGFGTQAEAKAFVNESEEFTILRRTLANTITALFCIGGVSLALAQTSPLPGPQGPPAKKEAAEPAADPELAKFRAAYTSGDGIAYVVINDAKGERIYRYGDASRLTAKRDTRGYMLFTCAAPHVFVVQKPEDKLALMKAEVVKAGEPRFAELDSKYVSNCRNPLVRSAIPKGKQS
jgi:hypothetical protein